MKKNTLLRITTILCKVFRILFIIAFILTFAIVITTLIKPSLFEHFELNIIQTKESFISYKTYSYETTPKYFLSDINFISLIFNFIRLSSIIVLLYHV